MSQRLKFYSDGGARGNPGPAAVAFVALSENGEFLKADSRLIGIRTNNQAEYEALLLALQYAIDVGAKEIVCYLDSQLVVKQLTGEYTTKSPELIQLLKKVRSLEGCFRKISFANVPRENIRIQQADELVNKALDMKAGNPVTIELKPNHQKAKENSDRKTMFVHTSIRTSNIDRSVNFYSKFLGMRLQNRREIKQTNAEIAFLQDPDLKGSILELTFYKNQTKFVQPQYEERLFDHLAFEVVDLNKTINEMKMDGVTVTDEPFVLNSSTTIAFVEDPDGTLIELIERK